MPYKFLNAHSDDAADQANAEADHHGGLLCDLGVLAAQQGKRRQALSWLIGAGTGLGLGALPLLGCGGGGDTGSGTSTTSTTTSTTGTTGTTTTGTTTSTPTTTSSCSMIPEETAGPFPSDGSKHRQRQHRQRAGPERHRAQ